MCGIVGFCGPGFAASRRDPLLELERMSRALVHRGPDDAGTWHESGLLCGLAHRRLSIVDLSSSGHQPMESHCKRYIMVFNGEIYNHRELRSELEAAAPGQSWRGTSDTETLLESIARWGVQAALARVNGMFAFSIWDRHDRKLTLARDRAGEKPLFYWKGSGFVAFASEVKALLMLQDAPRTMDRESLECYLSYGYVPGEGSMIAGIRRVAPASIVTYEADNGRWLQQKYWELPELADRAGGDPSDEELITSLDQKLTSAVQMQLQADVPVAVLLSGGLDSSLVAAFAAQVAPRLKTFTIGFPNAGSFDESAHARTVARHFSTDHYEIPLESLALDGLERIMRLQDEPLCDSSILPTCLLCQAVGRHVKVALGGDGGDELFGGYRSYNFAQLQQLARSALPCFVRTALARVAQRHTPLGMKGRAYLTALGQSKECAAARSLVLFDGNERRKLLNSTFRCAAPTPENRKEAFVSPDYSVVQTVTRMDFHSYLPDDILVKVDRAAMMSSLEVRSPMLDRHIIEFAFGQLPDRLKFGLKERKILLRRLGERVLPPELDLRRKQGFSIPLKTWLQTTKGAILIDAARALPQDLVRVSYLDELIASERKGGNNAERIFCLAALSFWIDRYQIRSG